MTKRCVMLLTILVVLCLAQQTWAAFGKKIIYHSEFGSGYTLPALMVAAMRQPDFIGLPLVLSRDNIPVVYPDLLLQTHTNVVDIFPGRHRADGNYYVIDFSLQELRRLSYLEDAGQFDFQGGHIASLEEVFVTTGMIALEFSASTRFLPVIKYPWFHANEAKDISQVVLNALIAHAGSADDILSCMCFDPDELQRIRKKILPGLPVTIRLIQAIDHSGGNETMRQSRQQWSSYNDQWLFTRLGLRVVASYADALWLDGMNRLETQALKRFIIDSQALELEVYFRVPRSFDDNFAAAVRDLVVTLNADGLAVANTMKLRDIFHTWTQQSDLLPETAPDGEADGRQQDNPSGALLSDPEGLLERLRRIQ